MKGGQRFGPSYRRLLVYPIQVTTRWLCGPPCPAQKKQGLGDPWEPFSIRFGQAGEVPCLHLPTGAVYLPLQLSEQRTAEWAAQSWEVACALLGVMFQQIHPGLTSLGERIHRASHCPRAESRNKETWSNSWLCSFSPSFSLGQG